MNMIELLRMVDRDPFILHDGDMVQNALLTKPGAIVLIKINGVRLMEYCGWELTPAARTVYFFYFGKKSREWT